jgi:hypothetical protein
MRHPTRSRKSWAKKIADRLAKYSTVGWDINFTMQPPNPQDCNTLALAFFQAIQLLQYQKPEKTLAR